jgi:hypothetical protein
MVAGVADTHAAIWHPFGDRHIRSAGLHTFSQGSACSLFDTLEVGKKSKLIADR